MNIFKNLVAIPWLWDFVQKILGAPTFKRTLYRSVLHPPGKLLDFGCATGHIADSFREFDYYGLDIDPDTIKGARERFKNYPNMHFIVADIFDRPFSENYFDEILLAATVHHLSDEQFPGILRELCRTLKPHGILHILDPVYQEKDGWMQRFFRRIDQGKFTRTPERIISLIAPLGLFDIGTPTFHTPYGALLQDCDFLHLPLVKKVS